METIESKFNLDDWNGYLHTYETIEEYNAAKKLLPHVARIESTKEAKYIPREELGNWYLSCDDIKSGTPWVNENFTENDDAGQDGWWLMNAIDHGMEIGRSYRLLGKIEVNGNQLYLWELDELDDNPTFNSPQLGFTKKEDDIRYLLTSALLHIQSGYAEDGFAYQGRALTTNLDVSYFRGGAIKKLAVRSGDGAEPRRFERTYNFIVSMYEV